MQVRFASGYDDDKANQVIGFMALVDGNWVFCLIPYQILLSCFGAAKSGEVEAVFVANRQAIESAAHALIRLGFVGGDHEVRISEGAFAHLNALPSS